MPNRILKESILDSPTLARLDDFTQDQFPRLLLLMDDWGCFNADPESIRGKAYSKRPKVTVTIIERVLKALHDAGMLFIWIEGERTWAFLTGWDDHNYCNGSQVDEDGKQIKHRRKTPEPPKDLLLQYVRAFQDKLGQVRTKFSIPIPIPNPIPIPTPNPGIEVVEEAPATPEALMEIYERERGTLLECRKLTDERKKKCRARIAERPKDPTQFLRDFAEAIKRARASPFMTGGGDRGWVADFDFFIANDKNYLRVLEGRYDARTKPGKQPAEDPNIAAARNFLHRSMAHEVQPDIPDVRQISE